MPNEINPMQTPPEVEYARDVLIKTHADKLKRKREIYDLMADNDKTDFLDFDFKTQNFTLGMPKNDFENQMIQSAIAANAYHTERVGRQSAVALEILKGEKNLLDAGDFDTAMGIVIATLHTRCDYFSFYISHALEKIKAAFADKKDWRAEINKLDKYNRNFTNDFEKMAIILNELENKRFFDFVDGQK